MNDELNGKSPPPIQPTAEQVAHADALLNAMAPPMKAAIGTTIRGLLFSFPGVAPHVILTAACFEYATFVGQCLQGDIAQMAQLRKGFRDAFEEGMRKAPIMQPPVPGSMPTNLRG